VSRFENAVGVKELYRMGETLARSIIRRHAKRLRRRVYRVTIDLNRGDVVSGNWPDCKLVVERDKGQAKTLADSKDSGDPSSGVSGREWKVFIPSGGVAAVKFWLKKTSSLCADCRLQNHQILSWESEWVLSRLCSSA
jgi:hypothetical protein